jgi:hypothetical protein
VSIKPIDHPLDGERVIALSPETANEAATDWLRRPNLFPGRALTAPTLEQRQRWQASRIVVRSQAFTRGVARGLEMGYTVEPGAGGVVRLQVTPGRALAASGEDLVLPTPVEIRLTDLPVVAEPAVFAEAGGLEPPAAPGPGGLGVLRPRAIGTPRLGELIAVRPDIVPAAGVLVLQPIVADRSDFDPTDPCDRCQCAESTDAAPDSFEDWRTADGVRLLWYAWPDEWRALPPDTARRRNALAHVIFDAEAALGHGEVLPWEQWGAPIALIGVNPQWQPVFADRAAVVRQGGRARNPRLTLIDGQLAADSRLPGLWQARIEQLAEQLAEMGAADAPGLAQAFTRLPPAGLLPTSALNLGVLPLNLGSEVLQSRFFPQGFELDAAPVPIPQLDVAIREAAPLAAIDFSAAERVRVLVPVTQASYEPRLLYEEIVAAEFQQTVDRFLLVRSRALGARQGLRNGVAALTGAITGTVPEVPAPGDDPLALEPEQLVPWGPPPAGGGHRAALGAGRHEHRFTGATATVNPGTGGTLFAWVHLDPDNPPQTLMLQWHTGGNWSHRAYWGANLIALGSNGTTSRLQIDDEVPTPGRWVRLTVDAASVGLDAATDVDGIAFTLFDGRAAYGATGTVNADGRDEAWFSGALPAGAAVGGDYPWEFLAENELWAPFEPLFGATSALPSVDALRDDPALDVLSTAELAQLDARGVDGFIAFLKSRADRADDLVDYGFIKVQTDVYRVRQLVLGTTAATRLAISPALATIAQAETAVASQEQISTFFQNLVTSTPAPRSTPPPSTTPAAPGNVRITRSAAGEPRAAFETIAAAPRERGAPRAATRAGGLFGSVSGSTTLASRPALGGGSVLLGSVPLVSGPALGGTTGGLLTGGGLAGGPATQINLTPEFGGIVAGDFDRSEAVRAVTDLGLIGISAGRRGQANLPGDVVNAPPIVGKAKIRTTAIAQRFADPKAIEAKDYTAATRHDAVAALIRLADQLREEDGGVTPGLFDGIDVYGVREDPFLGANNATRRVPLATFITDRARLDQLLITPVRTRVVPNATETMPDEGAYFSDSADLSDNTIALMRQLEGRINLYRAAIARAQETLGGLRDAVARGGVRLIGIEDELAEARHDVGVAKSLLAEETERIAGINQRRTRVLAEEVRFLAFVRPRESDNLASAPRHQVDPGLIDAPAPACLENHADVPEELTGMLRVVREAPSQWFSEVPRLLDRLDRPDLLIRVLQSAQLRTPLAATALRTAAPASRVAAAVVGMQSRQLQAVSQVRSLATQLDLTRISGLTWQGARDQATQVVSLGDLIDGEHGRGDVSRRAAQTFEEIGRIAACLHAEFSGVLPSIRLDWAETLSQFDEAPTLRRLGSLARWGEIPYTDRYQMQAFVDWLFSRINPTEPRAESLMNDVVRMCLLLASDAPVGRIIAGRLPRPVTVRPGGRLPLTAFDVTKLRVGMEALVYRQSNVVARAVVEDIGGSEIATRVIHTAQPQVDLDVNVRVQFGAATDLSRIAATKPVSRTAATKAASGLR